MEKLVVVQERESLAIRSMPYAAAVAAEARGDVTIIRELATMRPEEER